MNGLDPSDWVALRKQAHTMLDDIMDFIEHTRERPVWQAPTDAAKQGIQEPLPRGPAELQSVHQSFLTNVLPYSGGNTHPGFMGWVQGGGTAVGMLAEMLAAGMNANLGGRHQMPIELERQIVAWMRELFAFPDTASGLFVTGTSMANLMAVLVARYAAIGPEVRQCGLSQKAAQGLVAYTSDGSHGCVAQAMDLSGLGTQALRRLPMDADFRMDIAALRAAIERDLAAGLQPFLIVGTAGSVDVGAVDDLLAISELARKHGMWFHVDGAYGALGMLSSRIAPKLQGLQEANSIAFDFHKWGQVPYDAGFLLVRDGRCHRDTFASPAAYLSREARGISAGSPWPCDFGPDLSRGFRALKTWFTLKVYGADRLGDMIANTCDLAAHMRARIEREPRLELLAPVALNVVCFRYRCPDADRVNAEIVMAIQESGVSAPSSTTVRGCFAIRAAIVNHRTMQADVDALIDAVLAHGQALTAQAGGEAPRTEASHG